jgi:hypothetical protein
MMTGKRGETVARPITFRITPEVPQSRIYPEAGKVSPRPKHDKTLERRSSLAVFEKRSCGGGDLPLIDPGNATSMSAVVTQTQVIPSVSQSRDTTSLFEKESVGDSPRHVVLHVGGSNQPVR